MKASSLDLRQKILRACDHHLGPQRHIAALFGGSQAFVDRVLQWRTSRLTARLLAIVLLSVERQGFD